MDADTEDFCDEMAALFKKHNLPSPEDDDPSDYLKLLAHIIGTTVWVMVATNVLDEITSARLLSQCNNQIVNPTFEMLGERRAH